MCPSADETIKILHVDDELDHLELTKLYLEDVDPSFQVTSVSSPVEALKLVGGRGFDCIVSDYLMPEMDGVQLCLEVKKLSSIPFILYTGHGSEQVAEKAFAVGVDDYLRKEKDPSNYQVLARQIRQTVEKHRAEEKLRASEERFRLSVETLLDGFAILSAVRDEEGRIVDFRFEYINEAGCKIDQYTREEHLRNTLLKLLPAHKENGLFEGYVRVVETGEPIADKAFVYEDVYGGGQRLSKVIENRVVKLGDGFAVAYRDVTERNKAEETFLNVDRQRELRKTGIEPIGDVSWGTHFCQFYQTKEDLIDILAPYFKAGLENNEFCMWVTAEPLNEEEAKKAMEKALPDFSKYLEQGQIEIISYRDWYLKDGVFDSDRVLSGWVSKLEHALKKGYSGLRLTGNTFWLERNGWKAFTDYEEMVNSVIGKYRMIAICTYSLDKCNANEIIDVIKNHQFALIERSGKWELIESSEHKRIENALRVSEASLEAANEELRKSNDKLRESNAELESMTAELEESAEELRATNEKLQRANEELEATTEELRERNIELSEAQVKIQEYANEMERLVEERTNEIREVKERLEAFMISVTDPFAIWDRNLNLVEANNAMLSFFPPGTRKEDILGKNIKELAPGVEKTERYAKFLQVLETGEPAFLRDAPSLTGLGERLYDVKVFKLKEGIGVVNYDVTERKRLEGEVKDKEEMFRVSFENLIDPFGIYKAVRNKSGRIVDFTVEYVNEAACRANKMTREEQIGKGLLEIFPAHLETGLFDEYCRLVETGESMVKDSIVYEDYYGGEKQRRIFDIRAVKLGDGFTASWRDVTQREQARERRQQLEKMNGIGRMGAMIAHDLRGPLTAISQASELMRRSPEKQERMLEMIQNNANRSLNLVEGLRASTGEIVLQRQDTDVASLIKKTIEEKVIPDSVHVQLQLENVEASVDPGIIRRVLDNLVQNSIEAMPDGGALSITAGKTGAGITVEVQDTGTGIPEEVSRHMWEPFHSSKPRGMGLGLSFCKRAVEAHGGTISFRTGKEGTTFTVKIPTELQVE